jgi:hypothetical protein
MNARFATGLLFLALGPMAVAVPGARAQQPTAPPKDEALDDLLQNLSEQSKGSTSKAEKSAKAKEAKAEKSAKPQDASAGKPEPKGADSKAKAKGQPGGGTDQAKLGTGSGPGGSRGDKPAPSKPGGTSKVSEKDQELDDLLQKLGETKDEPSPDGRPKGPPGGGDEKPGPQPSGTEKPDRNKLNARDKETDEHLEELTGRRRKRKADDGQRSGKVGEMIKEMKDVEQKLGKPDTGEGTREQQKKIVKNIETMIDEAKRSGSSMGRMVRRVRRPGQQQGQDEGQDQGALARGVGPQKPLPPTGKHSTAGGKHEWGHLPAELRQEIDNQMHEDPLTLKKELIERYYLSVGKGKLVREE